MAILSIKRSIRAGRFLFLTFIGFAVAMSVSFLLARMQAGTSARSPVLAPANVEKAEQLRLLANELTSLAETYVDEIAKSERAVAPRARQWIGDDFEARLNSLRLQMGELAARYALPETELRILENAAGRLRLMAQQPENLELRRTGLRAALDCATAVERQIEEWGAGKYLHTPPFRPRFGEDS
ncbi:MAG: hypothetical protein KA184_07025 [Candidatus Hydrogenedentes bacterium]|nr:hypothetical protein [Candidatus Hydrogenedentota bacterium]